MAIATIGSVTIGPMTIGAIDGYDPAHLPTVRELPP